uniref:hypothetical protein n=1 Tax=Candidatus Scatocola faecipullorum TaxID=2840917 RepID=UPI004028099D
MKLSILLAGSILTSAIVGNVYAQTCGAQPSCSDLGYSYTGSTSDCVGPALKCPFNTSYFNCIKKSEMVNTIIPDYSYPKSLNTDGTTYTVGSGALASYSCGWVLFNSQNVNPRNNPSLWYINGAEVGRQIGSNGNWSDNNAAIFLLTRGNTFKLNGTATRDYLWFYPCKGF